MSDKSTAKLFMHGRSQAVRLPKAYRLPGKEERVSRVGRGILLEPVAQTAEEIRAIFEELATYHDIPFMENGREQPPLPDDDDELSFD